jgi:uncharacterized membrane protein
MSRLDLVTLLCAVGCGLVAGFFFAFSICVMKALAKLPPEQGIAAMQSINVVVINPWFLTVFFGVAAACALLIVASLLQWHDPRASYWLCGGVLYLIGTVLVTRLFNVPRNDTLEVVSPANSEAANLWVAFLQLDSLESRTNDRRVRGHGVIHHSTPISSIGGGSPELAQHELHRAQIYSPWWEGSE